MSSLLVFNRVYRLEILSVMLVFSTGFVCKSSCVSMVELTDGRRGEGVGAKSYDGEKALSAINHSILSDMNCRDPPEPAVPAALPAL